MPSVLVVGVNPSVVDPNDPAIPRGTTPESIVAGIQKTLTDMRMRGWHAEHCAITPDETVEATIAESLGQAAWDVVVIGAGIRLPPQHLKLFERVLNVLRKGAPNAAIAFNTTPADSGDAASRWLRRE